MDDSRATRLSLLLRIQDSEDGHAWTRFIDVYSPVVYGFARRHGLQDADAADVTQNVFKTVAKAIGSFDCNGHKGSFRGWLMSVTRSRLHDFWRSRGRQVQGSGDTRFLNVPEQLSTEVEEEKHWDLDYRKSAFRWAADQVRNHFEDSTWQAFWQTSVEGKDTKHIAESLGMTKGAVYIAKSRVLSKIKEKIREIEE